MIEVPTAETIKGSPIGDSMNPKGGNWFSAEFKNFADIADFMNEAKVNIDPKKIVWVNNRFYVLFLVDSSARIRIKNKKKERVNNGKCSSI